MRNKISNGDLTVSIDDLKSWRAGEETNMIHEIWQKFLESLSLKLKREASEKGLTLVKHPNVEEDWAAVYLQPRIKGATKNLRKKLEKMIPFVICLKEA